MTPSRRPTAIALACIFATLLAGGFAEAQMAPMSAGAGAPMSAGAEAPGPSEATVDCLTVLSNASDCLSYVMAGSNLTTPEKPCCGEMRQVITDRPDCLCEMLAKNNSIGIDFDVKRAMKLPSICHVSTPPVSMCSLIGVPVAVPAGAPGFAPSSGGSSDSSSSPGASPPGGATGGAATTGHLSGMTALVGAGIALLPFVFTF